MSIWRHSQVLTLYTLICMPCVADGRLKAPTAAQLAAAAEVKAAQLNVEKVQERLAGAHQRRAAASAKRDGNQVAIKIEPGTDPVREASQEPEKQHQRWDLPSSVINKHVTWDTAIVIPDSDDRDDKQIDPDEQHDAAAESTSASSARDSICVPYHSARAYV